MWMIQQALVPLADLFSHSTGNSTNNSEAMIQQHTLQEKALKNIILINKNYTLENTLLETQAKMALIIA
jgi:hypothetical protein